MGVAQTLTALVLGVAAPVGAHSPATDGAALQAVGAACAGASDAAGSAPSRLDAMSCGINVVRHTFGLGPVRRSGRLNRSALLKANAVRRCGFSHTPCGMAFSQTFRAARYVPARAFGENPSHRANLLAARWRDAGLAVERGSMFGHANVSLWVLQFGLR
jgi:hypothetical protein